MANDVIIPELVFRNVRLLDEALEEAREKCNLLAPIVEIAEIPEPFSVALRKVQLDLRVPDRKGVGGGGDIYDPGAGDEGTQSGEFALTAVALNKLSICAGIKWNMRACGRLDDRSDPYYVLYKSIGKMLDFLTGEPMEIGGEREVDLRTGSPSIVGWSEGRLRRAREHIHATAESKAMNRGIRRGLAIRGKYSMDDLQKPFVVPQLVFDLEQVRDPEVRRQIRLELARRAAGITTSIWGPDEVHGRLPAPAPALATAAVGADPALGSVKPPALDPKLEHQPTETVIAEHQAEKPAERPAGKTTGKYF